jgi:hypothetical protein
MLVFALCIMHKLTPKFWWTVRRWRPNIRGNLSALNDSLAHRREANRSLDTECYGFGFIDELRIRPIVYESFSDTEYYSFWLLS